ncbi:MAG: SEL1-like repeat protein [Woeseiaceae bacterium]|nr:SEL1-like repeat protein [Woeseiaceae bacterium]
MFLCLAAGVASGGPSASYPVGPVDAKTLSVQQKVDALFDAGDYERALFIYKNELAPLGDKYAQYMVGYMHLIGAGVDEDPVMASAWYRLAAERGSPNFVTVRDELLSSLSDFHLGRSDELYLQLRRKYSDIVILARLIREDLELISERTGSRITVSSHPGTIVDPHTGFTMSSDAYYRQLSRRVDSRLAMIAGELGIDPDGLSAARVDIDEIDRLVAERVTVINDRGGINASVRPTESSGTD